MMKSITFTCETITPMFLSGADGSTPELRPPSIKGALRFWWRAMNGHLSLEELKQKEEEIFGGTEGRSKVVIQKISHASFLPSKQEFNCIFNTYKGNTRRVQGKEFPTNAMYYLGYGVANWVKEEKAARFIRPYIPPGLEFSIKFRVEEDYIDHLLLSFKALEQFGGLGSKTRNAFGCFYIKTCKNDSEDKILNIGSIELNKFKNPLKSITCFSERTCLFETKSFHNWEHAFKLLAIAYQYARERIEEWHNWDKRELIGLPIVVKGERDMDDNFLERHAKPYFLHINKVAEGKYKGIILLLPYNYLEDYPDNNFGNLQAEYIEALQAFNCLLLESKQITLTRNGLNNA